MSLHFLGEEALLSYPLSALGNADVSTAMFLPSTQIPRRMGIDKQLSGRAGVQNTFAIRYN
jgi:hypothetical protein